MYGRIYDSVSLLPLVSGKADFPPRNESYFYAGATLMAVRVNQFKAHLVTSMPEEGHAGPDRGWLPNSGNDHKPYGVQKNWLVFNIEEDPSEVSAATQLRTGPTALYDAPH